jgi:hypothetical protein
MCDGSVRSITDLIDYSVYCRIMTPEGDKVGNPGSSAVDTPMRNWQSVKVGANDLER